MGNDKSSDEFDPYEDDSISRRRLIKTVGAGLLFGGGVEYYTNQINSESQEQESTDRKVRRYEDIKLVINNMLYHATRVDVEARKESDDSMNYTLHMESTNSSFPQSLVTAKSYYDDRVTRESWRVSDIPKQIKFTVEDLQDLRTTEVNIRTVYY